MAIPPMIPIHTLYWPNMNPTIVGYHKKCWAKLGIEITYTERQVPHDRWLDEVIAEKIDSNEAIGFVDIDCIGYRREAVEEAVDFALATGSFIGLAQSANHFPPLLPVYAAPSFLVISRAGYVELGRPQLRARHRLDAAQNLSAVSDAIGFPCRAIYPLGYHRIPPEGPWRLGNYGYYGIGSEYDGFFHLYGSSVGNADLFAETAERLLDGRGQAEKFPFVSRGLTPPPPPSRPTGDKWLRDLRYFLRRY
jgi:hypothetical protein